MRKLRDRLDELNRAEQDDRETRSRTDADKERKASEAALAELASKLVALSDKRLNALQLPEEVYDVVHDTRLIKSATARNRSLRRLRAVMRAEDTEAIAQRLQLLDEEGVAAVVGPGPVDVWLDKLLQDGDAALSQFLQEHPQASRQELRTLLRNARATSGSASAKKSRNGLRQLISSWVSADSAPPTD